MPCGRETPRMALPFAQCIKRGGRRVDRARRQARCPHVRGARRPPSGSPRSFHRHTPPKWTKSSLEENFGMKLVFSILGPRPRKNSQKLCCQTLKWNFGIHPVCLCLWSYGGLRGGGADSCERSNPVRFRVGGSGFRVESRVWSVEFGWLSDEG